MRIFDYQDYRRFLRDSIENQPKKGRGQVVKLAAYLKINSTMVSQVLSGTKDFSLEQAHEVAAYFGLDELEVEFFLLLIQKQRAGTTALRAHFAKKLEQIKASSLKLENRVKVEKDLTDTERAIFYSSWIYSAVRLLTSLGEKSIDEICEHFELARPRAVEILRFLKETGLCVERDGRYSVGSQSTHLPQGSPFSIKHHTNWRLKALQRSENLPPEEVMFTAPMSISKKDFEILREEFVQLIKKIFQTAKDSPSEMMVCVNLDWFQIER